MPAHLGPISRALVAATAVSLLAAAPTLAAKGKGPAAKVVTGAPVTLAGQFSQGSAQVICPKGTVAVAGGFETTQPVPGAQWIQLYESRRLTNPRGWQASGVQVHAGSGTISVSAVCEPLKATVKTAAVTVPLGSAGTTVTALTPCGRETKVLSGGFLTGPAAFAPGSAYVSRSIAGNGIGWVADATRLTGGTTGILTAYAYCADVGKIKTRSASAAVLGSAGASQTASTPGCPKKTSLRAGGFATSTPVNGLLGAALVYETRPAGRSWLSSAVPSAAATASTLVTNSYCRR